MGGKRPINALSGQHAARGFRTATLPFTERSMHRTLVHLAACSMGLLLAAPWSARGDTPAVEPLNLATRNEISSLYRQLIDAENRHDIEAIRPLVWNSASTLFVAKTADPAEGNWAGFWGTDVVMQHFRDLYQGTFHMEPDYARERVVGLSADVAQTYVPVAISVSYAGQTPVPKPFLMIIEWVRTPEGWRMATDIALPIPPAPPSK
jgi:hypothetical protein